MGKTWYNVIRNVDGKRNRTIMLKHLNAQNLPGRDFLPDGPIKDMGDAYFSRLPNVEEDPLSPESFVHPSHWSWVDYTVAYGLLYPYVTVFIFLTGVWGVIRIRRVLIKRENRRRNPCGNCGTLMFACAPRCPQCATIPPRVADISLIGFSLVRKTHSSMGVFGEKLRSHRRCPNCASFLLESKLIQSCPSCGVHPFSHALEVRNYDRFVQKRCWWTVLLVFIIGLIPILGPLLSGAFYKRTLIAPYSLYMNVYKESGLTVFLLILRYLFRFLPLIGIIGLPLLALVEDYVYRKLFVIKGRKVGWEESRPS